MQTRSVDSNVAILHRPSEVAQDADPTKAASSSSVRGPALVLPESASSIGVASSKQKASLRAPGARGAMAAVSAAKDEMWSLPLPTDDADAQRAIAVSLQHLGGHGFAAKEFVPRSVELDHLGMTHVRFDRKIQGVEVFGEQVITHIRNGFAGPMVSVTGDVEAIPTGLVELSRDPIINHEQALLIGLSAMADGEDSAVEVPDLDEIPLVQKKLFLDPESGEYKAGFQVELTKLSGTNNPRRMVFLIDGSTGEIKKQWNALPSFWRPNERNLAELSLAGSSAKVQQPVAFAKSGGVALDDENENKADDNSIYSGDVNLKTRSTYTLHDESRGKGIHTLDAKNRNPVRNPVDFEDDDDVWGEWTDPEANRAGVDAHYAAQMTYDMYKKLLGRDSIDGAGEALTSHVHVGRSFVNAFWNGTMNYGDGDDRQAGDMVTLDIGGHEIGHGLTERTAGLIYALESGGLNEAYSDIGGFLVEWLAAQDNPNVKWDWTMGEDTWTPFNGDDEDGLRYMNDPTRDNYSVDHFSKYPRQTEVHGSSGIANNAFYQLAEPKNEGKIPNSVSGIVVEDGIGIEKAAKIFYRALFHYMTPNTTFYMARAAAIQAAKDLYGPTSTEVRKTREAWTAVGVDEFPGAEPPKEEPAPLPPGNSLPKPENSSEGDPAPDNQQEPKKDPPLPVPNKNNQDPHPLPVPDKELPKGDPQSPAPQA